MAVKVTEGLAGCLCSDAGGDAGLEPMDTDGTEDATAATAELLLEVGLDWEPVSVPLPLVCQTGTHEATAKTLAHLGLSAGERQTPAYGPGLKAMLEVWQLPSNGSDLA